MYPFDETMCLHIGHHDAQSEKLFKMGQPRPLFVYFSSFQQQVFWKIIALSVIRTQTVEVKGEHADH